MRRLIVLEALERCEALLRTAGCELFFDEATAAALEAAGESILLHLSPVSHKCMVEDILRHPVTVRAHALWHLSCRTFRLNPRAVRCDMFEDFMGGVVQCASRSVAGTATQGIGIGIALWAACRATKCQRVVMACRLRSVAVGPTSSFRIAFLAQVQQATVCLTLVTLLPWSIRQSTRTEPWPTLSRTLGRYIVVSTSSWAIS